MLYLRTDDGTRTRVLVAITLAFISVVAGSSAVAVPPSEVAHSVFRGSLLIPTTAEYNAFPHRALRKDGVAELITGDYSAGDNQDEMGFARVIIPLGEEWNLQMQANNRAFGGTLTDYAWGGTISSRRYVPGSFNPNVQPDEGIPGGTPEVRNAFFDGEWVNVTAAKTQADEGGLGFGLRYAGVAAIDEQPPSGPKIETTSTLIGGLFSWGNDRLDIGLEAGLEFNKDDDPLTNTEGQNIFFTGFGMFEPGVWTLFGGANFGFGNFETLGGTPTKTDFLNLAFMGGIGRRLKDAEDGQTSIEGFIDFSTRSSDNNDTATGFKRGHGEFTIPGIRVASWEQLSNRWILMAGVEAVWVATGDVEDDETGSRTEEMGSSSRGYGWSLGVAFKATDNVRLEAQLNKDNLGKVLSLGNDDPLISLIGASATF